MRAAFLLLCLLAAPANAQCCLGAQDCEHLAENGLYRVRATSQTGTGPRSHGPYRFAFVYEALDADGAWRALGSFERRWETDAHFSMTVCASPTGNGFLLSSAMDRTVQLISPDGHTLRDVRRNRPHIEAALWNPDDRAPWVQASSKDESRRASLFVPFAELLDERCWSRDERDYVAKPDSLFFAEPEEEHRFRLAMLTWSEKQGAVDAPRAVAAIAKLRSDDDATVATGRAALLELGPSARGPVATAIANATEERDAGIRARLIAVSQRLDELACGHAAPHKNLDLLAAVLAHPHEELRNAAAGQLRRILPKGAEPTAAWLKKHAAELRWDEAEGVFVKTR